jgi:hypothetical protein
MEFVQTMAMNAGLQFLEHFQATYFPVRKDFLNIEL